MDLIKFTCLVLVISSYVHADFYDPKCTTSGFSCLDCYTQKLCFGGIYWSNMTCNGGSATNKNIYCNPETNQCTSVAPSLCGDSRAFQCPQPNGTFPDINNCKRYYVCKQNISSIITCPSTHVYHVLLAKCVFQLQKSDCKQITCDGLRLPNGVYNHPDNPSLYFQCSAGSAKLLSCPEGTAFDSITSKCQNICKGVYLVSNPKNCSEYISCEAVPSTTSPTFKPVKKACPKDYGFNPIYNECQRDLNKLCFEISNFNYSLSVAPIIPNFIKNFIQVAYNNLSVYGLGFSFLFGLGLPESRVSAVLLSLNYIVTNNFRLPAPILKALTEFILNFVPPNVKTSVEFAISIILGDLGTF